MNRNADKIYNYRLLISQEANVPGGPKNYIVDGKMTGGFAMAAYPVSYCTVDDEGHAMTAYDPDATSQSTNKAIVAAQK